MFINLGPKRWLGSSEHKRTLSCRFKAEPKRKRGKPYSASRAGPPDSETNGEDLERLYDKIFGTLTLGPSRERVFFDVYGLAVERLIDAERAIEAARSEFYRGDHPFDYSVTESAATVGGQTDE
ncbi:hypothetical protein [Salinibacter ruber]|uniref:hypothetical protein n=1 Tax=Salinibacter ruber TaxID=146919 RepID=UPI0021691F57|nr:hypothetical protein [Salinibacter ruber]